MTIVISCYVDWENARVALRIELLSIDLVPGPCSSTCLLPSTSFLHSRARERVTSNTNFTMPPSHGKPFSGSSCFNINPNSLHQYPEPSVSWPLLHCLTLFPIILCHVLQAIVTLNHYNFPTNSLSFQIFVTLFMFFLLTWLYLANFLFNFLRFNSEWQL